MRRGHAPRLLAFVLVGGAWAPPSEAGDAPPPDSGPDSGEAGASCGIDSTGAAPLDPSAPRAKVDASELGTLSQRTLDVVAYQTVVLAAAHDVGADEIRVKLLWDDAFDVVYGVRVSIETDALTLPSDDDDPAGPLVSRCTECGELELCTATLEGVVEALARYDDALRELPPEPEPAPSAPRPAAGVDARPRRLGPLGIAGISGLSVGAAMAVVGASLFAPGDGGRVGVFGPLYQDYRPPAYALLAVGGAAMLTGAILLGVDRSGPRSRRRRAALAPMLGPRRAGLIVTLRVER